MPIEREHTLANGLHVQIDRVEPQRMRVGKGTFVYVDGWCWDAHQRVGEIAFTFAGEKQPAVAFPILRSDVAEHFGRSALASGFCALIPVRCGTAPGRHEIGAQVTLGDGSIMNVPCTSIEIEAAPRNADEMRTAPAARPEPLIAVCMATYNPKLELFERQIESIRRQTHRRLVCIVSDDGSEPRILERIKEACATDDRFRLSPGPGRLGFYRNFERCLTLVPPDASFIALSDHDDEWQPEKLATLLDALASGALLAYSDMNIVSEDGELIAPSYWTERQNNYTDLASLILANTVTGAASLFRRELLDDVLPFPPNVGHPYHDHWIACVALALGTIAYVDRPLYDYVQHGGNVIGQYVPTQSWRKRIVGMGTAARRPRAGLQRTINHARAVYLADVIRLELLARTLEMRAGSRMSPERGAIVARFARLTSSASGFAWLLQRGIEDLARPGVTLGAERQLVRALFWRGIDALRARALSRQGSARVLR